MKDAVNNCKNLEDFNALFESEKKQGFKQALSYFVYFKKLYDKPPHMIKEVEYERVQAIKKSAIKIITASESPSVEELLLLLQALEDLPQEDLPQEEQTKKEFLEELFSNRTEAPSKFNGIDYLKELIKFPKNSSLNVFDTLPHWVASDKERALQLLTFLNTEFAQDHEAYKDYISAFLKSLCFRNEEKKEFLIYVINESKISSLSKDLFFVYRGLLEGVEDGNFLSLIDGLEVDKATRFNLLYQHIRGKPEKKEFLISLLNDPKRDFRELKYDTNALSVHLANYPLADILDFFKQTSIDDAVKDHVTDSLFLHSAIAGELDRDFFKARIKFKTKCIEDFPKLQTEFSEFFKNIQDHDVLKNMITKLKKYLRLEKKDFLPFIIDINTSKNSSFYNFFKDLESQGETADSALSADTKKFLKETFDIDLTKTSITIAVGLVTLNSIFSDQHSPNLKSLFTKEFVEMMSKSYAPNPNEAYISASDFAYYKEILGEERARQIFKSMKDLTTTLDKVIPHAAPITDEYIANFKLNLTDNSCRGLTQLDRKYIDDYNGRIASDKEKIEENFRHFLKKAPDKSSQTKEENDLIAKTMEMLLGIDFRSDKEMAGELESCIAFFKNYFDDIREMVQLEDGLNFFRDTYRLVRNHGCFGNVGTQLQLKLIMHKLKDDLPNSILYGFFYQKVFIPINDASLNIAALHDIPLKNPDVTQTYFSHAALICGIREYLESDKSEIYKAIFSFLEANEASQENDNDAVRESLVNINGANLELLLEVLGADYDKKALDLCSYLIISKSCMGNILEGESVDPNIQKLKEFIPEAKKIMADFAEARAKNPDIAEEKEKIVAEREKLKAHEGVSKGLAPQQASTLQPSSPRLVKLLCL